MHISMQFHFDSFEEFSQWASCLAGGAPVAVAVEPSGEVVGAATLEELAPAVQTAAPPTPRKRGRPAKGNTASGEDSAAPAAVEPAEPASPIKADAPDAPDAPVTEEQVKAKLEAVFQKHGFAGAQQLLSAVGVSRLRDATPEMYPVILAEADKKLAQ